MGAKAADAALVGVPEPAGLPFAVRFSQHFRPKLGKRGDGFAAIFAALDGVGRELLIVETGCMRIPGNWEGDGQSSFMFDALASERHGLFFSIDISAESLETARRACSATTQLIRNDSVAALHALSRAVRQPASLLYLDSFDLDVADPWPSAIHHALELMAARTLIAAPDCHCEAKGLQDIFLFAGPSDHLRIYGFSYRDQNCFAARSFSSRKIIFRVLS